MFFISAGFYMTGAILYMIFASGEVQTWAVDEPVTETDRTPQNLNKPKLNKV